MTTVALPLAAGRLCLHFGHCERFAFVEADRGTGTLGALRELAPPPHEPGVLPRWLKEQGADLVIAGGMGRRAQDLFAAAGVEVIVGAPPEDPRSLVQAWLDGSLATGTNACDH